MNSVEKLAYLKGLIEGLGLDDTKKDTRVIYNLVELLEDMVVQQVKAADTLKQLQEQVDAVDEDLGEIEKEIYEGDCDCDEPSHAPSRPASSGSGKKGGKSQPASELYYEVTCPTCGETITLDDDTINDGEVDCPGCGEKLEFDLEG